MVEVRKGRSYTQKREGKGGEAAKNPPPSRIRLCLLFTANFLFKCPCLLNLLRFANPGTVVTVSLCRNSSLIDAREKVHSLTLVENRRNLIASFVSLSIFSLAVRRLLSPSFHAIHAITTRRPYPLAPYPSGSRSELRAFRNCSLFANWLSKWTSPRKCQ